MSSETLIRKINHDTKTHLEIIPVKMLDEKAENAKKSEMLMVQSDLIVY